MFVHLLELPFDPDPAALLARLGLDPDSDEADDFSDLLERARPVTVPRGAYGEARVEEADGETGRVTLDGIPFSSRLLARNVSGRQAAWPFLATCGKELYDFVRAIPDPFERYWGEEIMQEALRTAMEGLLRVFEDDVYQGKTAVMTPGSLSEWPLEEQRPLFRLLADGPGRCGVVLTESILMLPNKSVSGIRFANEHGYVNCRLCPRKNCPNRQAEHDPAAGLAP